MAPCREVEHSGQAGLRALGTPAAMPHRAAFPPGSRHNTFLTEGYTRNVERAPSSHTHRMCQGRSKGKYQIFFFSQRRIEKKGFCKRDIRDSKEPRHKLLLLFSSFRMPHSKFPKAPASLCTNCKTPVIAFWDDLH